MVCMRSEEQAAERRLPGARAVTIVGLGLMGGSLARALQPFAGRLTAVDRNAATREAARAAGIFASVTADLAAGIAGADLVILAMPVRAILETLAALPALRPDGCAVFDLGSTKSAIGAAMEALPDSFAALGGHPLCGREAAGWPAARADLYRGQPFLLCRNERTKPAVEAPVLALLEAIGARPVFVAASLHDELLAVSSHLPYLLAAALVGQGGEGEPPAWRYSAGGFRDMTRLAGSDPAMMADIFLTNRTAVLAALKTFSTRLSALERLIATGDAAALHAALGAAQGDFAAYRAALDERNVPAERDET